MSRKPVTSLAKSEALQGNQRAVKEPAKKVKPRDGLKMSLNHRRREGLRAAMIAQNGGGWPDNDEVVAAFRRISYAAVDAFIEQAEQDHEEAMIV